MSKRNHERDKRRRARRFRRMLVRGLTRDARNARPSDALRTDAVAKWMAGAFAHRGDNFPIAK